MRPEKYSPKPLIEAFKSNLVLSHGSIMSILGTTSKMTILRKLKTLDYCTSYSQAGRYYVLKRFIPFDEYGLWSQSSIHFSKFGSLMKTIPVLIKRSLHGYFARELKQRLLINVHDALVKLYREDILNRHQIRGEYLYLSPELYEDQLRKREQILSEAQRTTNQSISDETADHMRFLLSMLNEKQSRLYLGFESIRFGYGGDTIMARIAGVNIKTVSRGRRELESKQITINRIRNTGAGRPTLKKN